MNNKLSVQQTQVQIVTSIDPLLEYLEQLPTQDPNYSIYTPIPKRIAYLINYRQSSSDHDHTITIRTQGIAKALNQHGYEVLCFTRLGWSWGLESVTNTVKLEVRINGVRCIHSKLPNDQQLANEQDLFDAVLERLKEIFIVYRPQIVLNTSDSLISLAALVATHQLSLPFYHEKSDLGEFFYKSKLNESSYDKDQYLQNCIVREVYIAQKSDHTFVLSQSVKERLHQLGVPTQKISIVPNGIEKLPELKQDIGNLRKCFNIEDQDIVVGHLASGGLNIYEGIDNLMEAFSKLLSKNYSIKLLIIVSENPLIVSSDTHTNARSSSEKILSIATRFGCSQNVIIVGSVPHQNIGKYYSIIDLMVIPAKSSSRGELFAPIKAIESLAYGVPILASGIMPLLELIEEAKLGSVYPEASVEELSKSIHYIAKEIHLYKNEKFTEKARLWVSNNRLWTQLTKEMDRLFSIGTNKNKKQASLDEKDVRTYDLSQLLMQMSKSIPTSNGSQYYEKLDVSVAIITDEFMYNYYNGVFEKLVYLTPENYQNLLEKNKIDLFLYVSCWSGISNNEWRGIKFRGKPKNAFKEILCYCQKNSIATIFQTIEDPSNYDQFLEIAKQFDYIFTTDVEKIDNYICDCGHDKVFYGEFGVNPIFNNPIGLKKILINGALFAGSYPARYKERCNDMNMLFDLITEANKPLIIANRNSHRPEASFKFPSKYSNNIIPRVEHDSLQKIHKLFKYNINFNSIKRSSTMCAMRVYELQAQGALLLSNYAKSINEKFPHINIVNTNQDMRCYFDSKNDLDDYENRIIAIREIMTNKTVFDQSSKMLINIGFINAETNYSNLPKVLILCYKKNFSTQSSFACQAYGNCELYSLAEIRNIKYDNFAYVTFFDPNNEYEAYYLVDMINAFKYTSSKYITKSAYFTDSQLVDGVQHDFVSQMPSKYRTLFDTSHFDLETLIKMEDAIELEEGYSIDPFELNYSKYCEMSKGQVTQYDLSVIVPVYNNGKFLLHKALQSLRRNRSFSKMEIILVDDGSDDQETLEILNKLKRKLPNVKLYKFESGGSGSASRSRNKGIGIATSPLITFLDPDNEISNYGYDILLDIFKRIHSEEGQIDFVSGYQVKIGKAVLVNSKHANDEELVIDNPKKYFLLEGKFPIVSTQAAIIKKDVLINNAIDFIVGAVGQDTVFGHELLSVSEKCAFTSKAHLIYYAERSDSVTNVIDSRFFKKSLKLEIEQKKRFMKYNIFDSYKEKKAKFFIKNWYLEKYKLVCEKQKNVCKNLLIKIIDLYQFEHTDFFGTEGAN